MKTAGILLIIFGLGMPLASVLVEKITLALNPNVELIGLWFNLTTRPVIFVALWVLPIIGGIFALMGKHYTFVLVSSCFALFYWLPFLVMVVLMIQDQTENLIAYLLYLPLLIIAVFALVNIIKSRNVGNSR